MSEVSRVAGTHRPLRDTSFITSVAARARPNAVWSEVTSAWHRSCVLCIVIPPVWRSRTRYTAPNVPLPICRSLVYCWRFRSDVGVGSKGAMVCLGGSSARVAELKVMEVTQQATGRTAVRPCQSVSSGESTSHTVTRVASNNDCVMFRWLFKRKRMPFPLQRFCSSNLNTLLSGLLRFPQLIINVVEFFGAWGSSPVHALCRKLFDAGG